MIKPEDVILEDMIFIDATNMLPPPAPSWMIGRWDRLNESFERAEREEVAAAGVTDFDDFGDGRLCFNGFEDASTVAQRLADGFCMTFGVFGSDDAGKDG